MTIPTEPSARFLPTRASLERAVRGARLLALCSPQNPAGTAFTAGELRAICALVVEENARRGAGERPLYLMYDQVYWTLTFGDTHHEHPIGVCPEVAPYTVYVDGISKALAATGVRVGWIVAPPDLAKPMSGLLGHMGAWAPKAAQSAVASYLDDPGTVAADREELVAGVRQRLDALYDGFVAMREDGLPVDVIAPEGAIYLSVKFAIGGRTLASGTRLDDDESIRAYLLHAAGLAVVPFRAFGVPGDCGWFRLSVGAVSLAQIEQVLPRLRAALLAA